MATGVGEVGAHTTNPAWGALGKPHPSGCGFLAYGVAGVVAVVKFHVKNKLDFLGQLGREKSVMDMYDYQNDYGYAYDGEGCYDYESESDYESDYGEESYADNDDAWANRDAEDEFLSRTCVSDKPSLDKVCGGGMTVLAKSRRGAEPKPVQLAAKTSSFKTMMQAKFAAADKAKKEAEEKEKAERAEAQRLAEEKMKEELRLKAVVANLPTESRAAKEAKEKVWKETTFGHRRNGGGKSRGRYAAEVDAKVVAERRAERRKEAAMNRKMELEMNRKHISKAPTVIKLQKPVIVEKVEEDEARVAWAAAGNDSDEFNMVDATKLVEAEEQKAEAEAMAEVVELVATKICDDKSTKMERIIAEQKKEEEDKAAAEKKAAEEAWTEVKRSSKSKEPLVLKMGQTSHRETKRSETKRSGTKDDVRTVAHEKLSDKKEIEKNLTKTRLCKSLETGEVCRHGVRCRFAHSLEELVVAKCVFGAECRRVECGVGGCYKNCGDRVCSFIHPDEDKEGFYVRTGLKKPTVCVKASPTKASPVKASPTKASPTKASPTKASPVKGWDMSKLTAPVKVVEAPKVVEASKELPGEGWTQVKRRTPTKPSPVKAPPTKPVRLCESVVKGIPCRHGANCRFSHSTQAPPAPVKYVPPPKPKTVPVCESVALGIPCRHGARCRFAHPTPVTPPKPVVEEETVVRVPKEMFLQAMEMAMKSGKTNIRVEIIGS
jgi:hypothetical protein